MMSEIISKKIIIIQCLEERLNISQIEKMKKRLLPFINRSNVHIVLDLSRVLLMDCAMLGFLITYHQTLNKRNSTLSLYNPSEFVKLLIDSTKISEFIYTKKNC